MNFFKRLSKFFLILALIVILFWTILLGTLQTKTGQDWIFHQAIAYFEKATHTTIKVKNFHFSFPLKIELDGVVFLREERPIMTIKTIELCCAYTTLLQGRLIFSHLQVEDIHILELINTFETLDERDSTPWKTPRENPPQPLQEIPWETPPLPFYLKFENLDIQKLKLDSKLINILKLPPEIEQVINQATFNLNGSISNNPFKSALKAHLLMTAKNDQTDSNLFTLGIDTQNHQLALSFHSSDFPLKIVNAELAPQIKGDLALFASAPILTWQNLASHPIDHNESIEGHFKFILEPLNHDQTHLISTMIGQQTIFKGNYSLNSKNELKLQTLQLENSNISLTGKATLNSDKMIDHSLFRGQIHHFPPLEPWIGKDIQGAVTFEAKVSGDLFSPHLVLNLESSRLLIANQAFENIHSTLETTHQIDDLNGFFSLSFNYQKTPWTAFSSFHWKNQEQWTFSRLEVKTQRSLLQGELTCAAPDFIWEGFLNAQTEDLNDFSRFFAFPLEGQGELKFQLGSVLKSNNEIKQDYRAEFISRSLHFTDGKAEQVILNLHLDPVGDESTTFHVNGSLDAEKLQWKDFLIEQCAVDFSHELDAGQKDLTRLATRWEAKDIKWSTGQAEKAVGRFQIENPLKELKGEVKFVIYELKTSSMHFKQLAGATKFKPEELEWPFQLKGKGFLKEDLLFTLDGAWHFKDNQVQIFAQRLTGRLGPYPLQLKHPFQLRYQADQFQLTNLWVQWGEAEIQGEFLQDKENILSQFTTNAVPSEFFHFIAPDLPLTGRATFQGKMGGTIHQPQGELEINLRQIQVTEEIFAQKPFVTGNLFLNFDQRGIQLQSELNGIGNTPLLITGELPFKLDLNPMEFKFNQELPFHLTLNAEGELDPYLHLFYNDTTNLSGHAKIGLNLSGQVNAPQIQGNIDLINGAFESLNTGALYHNIQAHLEGDGSKIILTHLSAEDSKNGQILATGSVNLDITQNFPFEFEIHPSRIFILDSDYIDISASGILSLTGNTKGSKLDGELTIDQAAIHLEEALPQTIKNIEIQYINAAEDDPVAHHFKRQETHFPLELNVKLNAPKNIQIVGDRLKSEWKGSLLVTGKPEDIQLQGNIYIEHGEYDFKGKIFNLSQGNIHFAGAVGKKTNLYVIASKEIDRITAEIIVKGPVKEPLISFRSNPPLSQREVLSYILFNHGISGISKDQEDQLSQSLASLNSSDQTKSGDDFLSRLRNNIGLDHLDFTTFDNLHSTANDHLDFTTINRLDFPTNDSKDNKNFGLQVGKHITDKIMVRINQSMVSPSPIIAVEAKLRKNLKAQAETGVGQDAPIRMSIKWKKDY